LSQSPSSNRVEYPPPRRGERVAVEEVSALLIVFANIVQIHAAFGGRLSAPATWINDEISPLPIHTGLFVVMTTARPEIIIEGSDDGVH
jgi:hypothetical protein